MTDFVVKLLAAIYETFWDVLPIVLIIFGFQVFVVRRAIPNLGRVLIGFAYVVVGLTCFVVGLKESVFPLGELMAAQLTEPAFLFDKPSALLRAVHWQDYRWVYVFAAAIGFATTVAEPALIAVAIKAREVSGGAIGVWGLRIAVAIGVAMGIALGTFRIVTGTPLHYYIIVGYVVVLIQTALAPRMVIALAYDSGGVTTSTVTVPLVTALGLGLAGTVPGRNVVHDGFGLIAFASLFPMITVMGYAQITEWRARRTIYPKSEQSSEGE